MTSIICTILAVLLCLPPVAYGATANDNHWAKEELNKWEKLNIISANAEPNKALTRIEVISILNKLFGFSETGTAIFTDVDASSAAGKQISLAVNADYLKGYEDQTFRPDRLVSRAEIAVILQRIFQFQGAADGVEALKDAANIKQWSKEAIGALLHDQYIQGYPDQSFKPERNVTLAELVKILDNIAPVVITKPGEYSNIEAKNIIIASPNVTLSNSLASNNIYIVAGAAGGSLTLNGVNVQGTLYTYIALDQLKLGHSTFGKQVFLKVLESKPQEPGPSESPAPSATPTPTTEPTTTPRPTPSPTPSLTPEPTEAPTFAEVSVHDPSIIKEDGTYYVFGSHIEAAKSNDLMSWETFTNGYTTPNNVIFGDLSSNLTNSFAWAGEDDADSKEGFSVWAPDVMWVDEYDNGDGSKGAYLMYYSVSSTYIRSAIGIAASKTIEGPYHDVETIIYSGFTKEDGYDTNSDVNKNWENTNIASLIEEGVLEDARSGWFNSNGSYNNSNFPNAIDANLYRGTDNKLYMSYGSWSGGIFVLELDPETGLPIYPGVDSSTEDGRMIDRYFGTKISGGFTKSGEGPYVVYDPESEYFFLFVTYGWLGIDGEYNMRVFRSTSPTGPFTDALGQSAVLPSNTSPDPYGNKIMGHYFLERNIGEAGSGQGIRYVSPGHNSVYIDAESGERFVVFHTRFSQEVDGHQLRIHQLILNENDWLVATPYRYSGEALEAVNEAEIVGEYKYLNHEKDSSKTVHTSDYITLHADHSITGAVTGSWELADDYTARITIGNQLYTGAFLTQWDSASEAYVKVFTAMSDEGKTIWGSKLETPNDLGNAILNDLTLAPTENIISNITLPTVATRHIAINWSSSNPEVITETGEVTRPYSDQGTAAITLTATFEVEGELYEKEFEVSVKPIQASTLRAQYNFEENLTDQQDETKVGTVIGAKLGLEGGTVSYGDGVSGQSLYLDGETGILLPSDLIASDTYSVAMWLKPEQLTQFTTVFFGAQDDGHWISLLPQGNVILNTVLWHRNNTIDFWFDARSNITIPTNDWSHVAFTVEEGYTTLYINGVKMFTGQEISDLFSDGDSVFSLAVNYWDTPYKGYVDELTVYEGVLSEEQITAMQTTDTPVTEIQLTFEERIVSVGQSFTPTTVIIEPAFAANKELNWSSSDHSIATVDSFTGQITAIAEGSAVITAAAVTDSAVTVSYRLHVVEGAIAYFNFDQNLNNQAVEASQAAQYVGPKIGLATSHTPVYTSAISNDGIVLDGAHGVVLPSYYFHDNSYTVSFYAQIHAKTSFTPLFFASQKTNEWFSFVPAGAENTNYTANLWSNNNNGLAWFDGVSEQVFPLDEWVHITISVNGNTAKLYYDGVLIKTFTNFPSLFTSDHTTVALGVNFWDDAPAKGIIDELFIYDYTLTDEEVAAQLPQ